MPLQTRLFFELQVGRTHSVDVLLHLRRADVEWFQSSPEHKREIFRLLSKNIVPKEFELEIEDYHQRRSGHCFLPPSSRATAVGEKHAKRKRGGGKKRKGRALEQPVVEPKDKSQRDIRHVFGDSLQISYRTQETNHSESATLLFPTKKRNEATPTELTMFRQLSKLSKRIDLWCFPKDSENSDYSPSTGGGGFLRPEMVPIASLFRTPPPSADND